jgi:acyl-CoA thioester hydrolase
VEKPARNPFELRFTVRSEDLDELDHVSNVIVLFWMNRAAVEHSSSLGWDLARYRSEGGVFVVRRHEIDYLASAKLGDQLVHFTWPSAISRATAERKHEIRRVADDKVIARGMNVWAYVDVATGRPMRLPPALAQTFDPAKFA